eukprot:NODE_10377_length_1356_cov_6.423922.p1 GENE.NODE_10377_length_1356_cov_6.423922~~NODE_10377_length_1356_cov_6.423922.p1  ORF type:complete len:298 (-),score=59.19 NODE_10377_length_1356_cov_6.423922:463-1236(-)
MEQYGSPTTSEREGGMDLLWKAIRMERMKRKAGIDELRVKESADAQLIGELKEHFDELARKFTKCNTVVMGFRAQVKTCTEQLFGVPNSDTNLASRANVLSSGVDTCSSMLALAEVEKMEPRREVAEKVATAEMQRFDDMCKPVVMQCRCDAEHLRESCKLARASGDPMTPQSEDALMPMATGLSERVDQLEDRLFRLLVLVQSGTVFAAEQGALIQNINARQSTLEGLAHNLQTRLDGGGLRDFDFRPLNAVCPSL